MGFSLKKITGGIKKAANVAFNPSSWVSTAKDVMGSKGGGLAVEALGSYFGYPGLGTALKGMLGGNGDMDWGALAGAGIGDYLGNATAKKQYEEMRSAQKEDYDRYYEKQLQGIQSQNATAKQIADEANAMSQSNAREQMLFQAHYAGNAHQREVTDLRAAGLNPILSGTGGMGSIAPSGASGSVVTAPVRGEQDAMGGAMQAITAVAEAFKANSAREFMSGAQTKLATAQTAQSQMQAKNIGIDTFKKAAETKNIGQQTKESKARVINIGQQVQKSIAETMQVINQGNLTNQQIKESKQRVRNLQEINKNLKMIGDVSATQYGKIMEMVKRAPDINIDKILKLIKP